MQKRQRFIAAALCCVLLAACRAPAPEIDYPGRISGMLSGDFSCAVRLDYPEGERIDVAITRAGAALTLQFSGDGPLGGLCCAYRDDRVWLGYAGLGAEIPERELPPQSPAAALPELFLRAPAALTVTEGEQTVTACGGIYLYRFEAVFDKEDLALRSFAFPNLGISAERLAG